MHIYLAIGPARHAPAWARARHGPQLLGPARHVVPAGRARTGLVPGIQPKHRPAGRVSGRASPTSPAKILGQASPQPVIL
jgi:hypothetical protein